jgi:hypothetical protein
MVDWDLQYKKLSELEPKIHVFVDGFSLTHAKWLLYFKLDNYPPRYFLQLSKLASDGRQSQIDVVYGLDHVLVVKEWKDEDLQEASKLATEIITECRLKCRTSVDYGTIKYTFWLPCE